MKIRPKDVKSMTNYKITELCDRYLKCVKTHRKALTEKGVHFQTKKDEEEYHDCQNKIANVLHRSKNPDVASETLSDLLENSIPEIQRTNLANVRGAAALRGTYASGAWNDGQ